MAKLLAYSQVGAPSQLCLRDILPACPRSEDRRQDTLCIVKVLSFLMVLFSTGGEVLLRARSNAAPAQRGRVKAPTRISPRGRAPAVKYTQQVRFKVVSNLEM